jgi:large subunit ribosomal protein L9
MAKTEIILTHNIVGLGAESDQVKVAAGYARNYLFPKGMAIPLTGANKRRIEALRRRRAEREAHEFNTMSELSRSISKLTAVLSVKTGDDGKMFGSVTAGAIADQLQTQFDIALDKKKIHLPAPIRTTGDHEVELRLHHDVPCTLKVRVESSTQPPEAAAKPVADAGKAKEKDKDDARGARKAKAPETAKQKPSRPAQN